jgi:anti-sigma B factor antagonist
MAQFRRISLNVVDGVTVIRFVDHKILDPVNIQELAEELFSLVEEDDHNQLLLNFADVDFLSSAALNKLISLNNKVQRAQQQLKICSLRPEIYEVFVITRLNQMFEIKDDEASAIAEFKAEG